MGSPSLHSTITAPRIAPEDVGQDALLAKYPHWTLAHWCVSVAAVSFLILALLPEARLVDFDISNGAENVRVARSLATQGAFADPFASRPTGSTAHVAPLYPIFYAAFLSVLGTGPAALLVLWGCNVSFLAAQMGLLPLLSHRLHLGILPGILAAALGTFSLYAPIDTRWECFLAGLLLLLAFLNTASSLNRESRRATLAAGILWGLAILANPVTVLLMAAWPLCWLLAQSGQRRFASARRLAVIAAVALLVLTPWIGRNYFRFGSLFFVRDNLGLELYTANNPCAASSLRENLQSGCHFRTHPNANASVAARLAAAGEIAFNRAKLQEAWTWIDTHRSDFLALTLRRSRLFWLPDLERPAEAALVWMVTLLSLASLWAMARKNPLAAALMVMAWLVFPLIYYVTQFDPRYRYPIYWTSLLPAGYGLARVLALLPFFASSRLPSSAS